MSFLLGSFGPIVQTCMQKIINCAKAQPGSVIVSFDQGILIANTENTYDSEIITLDNKGLLLGKLFNKLEYGPAKLAIEDIHMLINRPTLFTKNFWGSYCGAFYNNQNKKCVIIRDPIGLSTIFYSISSKGIIFSTNMDLLYDILETKPSIDLNYFANYIVNRNQALSSTPFQKVKELLPGTQLTIQSDGNFKIEKIWDFSSSKGSSIKDENEFKEELLSILRSCIKAWVGDSPGVCLELSGGTDSSALMILLRDIFDNKKLIGVNYIDSKTPSSNEIQYAQEVVDICKAPLYFLDWKDFSVLDPLPNNIRPNKPSTLHLYPKSAVALSDIAKQNGNLILMNGQGGDHVFISPQPQEALADYWIDHGFYNISKPAQELIAAYRMPAWLLTKQTIKNIWNYYKRNGSIIYDTPFLTKEFMESFKPEEFYLKEDLINFYPGKAAHISSLAHAISYAERNQVFSHAVIHPFLSQPIVELGLKIPTYQSFGNGFDRILLRKAISKVKTSTAMWRKTKGETTSTIIKEFSSNADKISEIILDGKLVNSGMIDKQWLNDQLIRIRHGQAENLWPIMHILTSQIWLNQWQIK